MSKLVSLLALLLCSMPCLAEEQQATTSTWTGVLDALGTKLRLEIDITVDGDRAAGKLRSLDQGNSEFELSKVKVSETLSFEVPQLGATFEGKIDKAGKVAEGKFQQNGMKLSLALSKGDSRPAEPLVEKEPEVLREAWVGTLNMGILKPIMQFRVIESNPEDPKCYFDSITEGATGFAGTWEIEEDRLKFTIPRIRLEYEGKLDSTGATAEGTWKQGGRELPLTLNKQPTEYKSENTWQNRPQRPRGPYPYDREKVTFENTADSLTLAGTLTIPKSPGKHPAVVLISGSGPQDRDETLMEHKPFLVLADYLSRRGIAVLRYDDRGFGESTGKFSGATTADFAKDASAAVEFLKSHDRIDANQVGLAGHSEGGLIAPIVCQLRDDVAFVVLMAATGVDGATIITSQTEAMLRVELTKPEEQVELETGLKINKLVIDQALKGDLNFEDPEFAKQLEEILQALSEEEIEAARMGLKAAKKRFEDEWIKFFIKYDPRPALSDISCPVLAIIGSKDLQVLPDLNMPEIKKALEAGGNKDFELVTIDGLNHLFQECETGSMNEYISIQETWNPKALKSIGDWIEARTNSVSE